MAKIICEFDTVEKTLSITMDGKKVKDVVEANFSTYYDDKNMGFCELKTAVFDEESKIATKTRVIAMEGDDLVEKSESISQTIAKVLFPDILV